MQAFSARVAIKNKSTTNFGDRKYWKPHICLAHFLPTPVEIQTFREGGAPVIQTLRTSGGGLVCYTAVFTVVTQRSAPLTLWGGALRDYTKNGCVAD